MSKKIYRIMNPVSEDYYSEVSGCLRLEEYNRIDAAYVYNKADALSICKAVQDVNSVIQKMKQIPDSAKENHLVDPIIVQIDISDVKISPAEERAAINSAPLLGLSGQEAIQQARWQRVRRYKNYLHYDPNTPSHQYIYLHDFF